MRRGAYLSVCLLSGCGLLEVGPASEITGIEPVSIRTELIALGPLNPARVAFPSDSPIAEALPGDRVRLTIEVVGVDGLALAEDRLDSVWFMRGTDGGSWINPERLPELEQRCEQLELWTSSSYCQLGEGQGSVEFEVPPLDETSPDFPAFLSISAVIAWDGQSALECWEARIHRDPVASDCDFVHFPVRLGPRWWFMTYAADLGIAPWFPIENIPAPALLQQANRAPKLERLLITRGTEVQSLPPTDGFVGPFEVVPGERLHLSYEVDENLQFSQAKFFPLAAEGELFTLIPEQLYARVATAGPIRVDRPNPIPASTPIEISVDDDAPPGLARVVLAVSDDDGGEQVVRVELEIR